MNNHISELLDLLDQIETEIIFYSLASDKKKLTPKLKNLFGQLYCFKSFKENLSSITNLVSEIEVAVSANTISDNELNKLLLNILSLREFFQAQPGNSKPIKKEEKKSSGLNVMIIDDEEDLLAVYAEEMKMTGAKIQTFKNSVEAFKEMEKETPDLLITDLRLENESGFDIIQLSKIHFPKVPILVISGFITPKTMETLKGAGVKYVLDKPFHMDTFSKYVLNILG